MNMRTTHSTTPRASTHPRHIGVVAGASLAAFTLAAPACAGPTLELAVLPGPGVRVAVRLRDIAVTPVSGWQAFLEYDPSRLTFQSGQYVATNFGLPLISPITAQSAQIDLAAGLNAFAGQTPTTVDQDIAYLNFAVTGSGCLPQVRVRSHNPPTRLTDQNGAPIEPLTLINLWSTCLADINRSGTLEVQDIFDFLGLWFAGDCRADFNGVGGLSVGDIFDFLSAWFAGCP